MLIKGYSDIHGYFIIDHNIIPNISEVKDIVIKDVVFTFLVYRGNRPNLLNIEYLNHSISFTVWPEGVNMGWVKRALPDIFKR